MSRNDEQNKLSSERARRKIIDAAVGYSIQGTAGASVADITQRAGVAQGLMNYHFGSKDRLISAVIELWFSTQLAVGDSDGEGDELLADFIDDTFRATDATLPLQRVVSAMKVQPHTRRLFADVEERFTAQETQVEDDLREVFRERGASDPVMEEIMLRSTLEGVVATEATYGDSFPLEESRRWVYNLYDLPEPEPLLDEAPREEDPRLRATKQVPGDRPAR